MKRQTKMEPALRIPPEAPSLIWEEGHFLGEPARLGNRQFPEGRTGPGRMDTWLA